MAPPKWNCELCCEDFRDYTSIDIDGCSVCPACVQEMFDKALKFEHEYPPNWSGPLHPSEFSHILSADYIERYKRKEVEYKTQPGRRIYCQHLVPCIARDKDGHVTIDDDGMYALQEEPCGEFIGVRQRVSKPDMLVLGRCKKCKNATCMVCDDYSSDPKATLQHICAGKSSANEKRAQAFIGLKRGKDWQQCPSRLCGRRVELSAACNHITCMCGTGFCFICGAEADGDSEHWARKSGCPRYNHPEDLDAEYDDAEYDDDDDEAVDPTRDELGSDIDPLENVRDLFEVDEVEETVAPTSLTAPLDEVMAQTDTGTLFDGIPTRAASPSLASLIDELRDEISMSTRIRSTVGAAAESVVEAEAFGVLHRSVPRETNPGSADNVQAVQNAYFEDDLSDQEREFLGNSDGPSVTMEEAEIDRALWRMRVD